MKRLAFTTLLLLIVSAFSALAQSPVQWNVSTRMTSATEGIITISADIEPGWHVYGTTMPEDGPNPTKIFLKGTGVKMLGTMKVSPRPTKEMDSMFGVELTYWGSKVTFSRKFVIENRAEAKISVAVEYMCCNDSSCRPPKREEFTVELNK